jgi:hypothetical protein
MTTLDHLEQDRASRKADTSFDTGLLDLTEGNEHPLVQLPFSVLIDGRAYEGVTISMVGAKVAGLAAAYLNSLNKIAIFRFNFGGFWISLPIDVAVTSADSEKGSLTLRFREPTGAHMPQLRYLLNSWLAGDHVSLDGMIEAKSRLPKPGSSHPADGSAGRGRLVRRIFGTIIVAGASVALIALVGSIVGERFFVSDVSGASLVYRQGATLAATASGQVDFIDPAAGAGKPAYSILAANGISVTVAMPCDCNVEAIGIEKGATVLAGEPLMFLSSKDAPLLVRSTFDARNMQELATGAVAEIELGDGRNIPARTEVDRVALSLQKGATETIPVNLLPVEPLPDTTAGQPVKVRLDRTPEWLKTVRRSLSDSIAKYIEEAKL